MKTRLRLKHVPSELLSRRYADITCDRRHSRLPGERISQIYPNIIVFI